jgi:16S rRNA (guanine527-N7)-methyltransferase
VSSPAPVADPVAAAVFGPRLPLAQRYAELLSGTGVEHGLIGPRERDRIWERHLVNSALLGELLPIDAHVVDVGSGAGLPGLALACVRADLVIDLVESLQRRVDFLHAAVESLGVDAQVRVIHGRAESAEVRSLVGGSEWVTARAVAPLDRLAGWCLPLLRRGGRLLAMKGARADAEVLEHADAVRRAGAVIEGVVECGVGIVAEPARVIVVRRG